MHARFCAIAIVILATFAGCGDPTPTVTVASSSTPSILPTGSGIPTAAKPILAAAKPVSPTVSATPIPLTVTFVPPTATLTASATDRSPTALPVRETPEPTSTALPDAPPVNPSVGDAWIRPTDGMIVVFVPGGTFQMGGDEGDPDANRDELPRHTVTLDGFWIDQTEVNNAQFVSFLNENGNIGEGGKKMVEMRRGYCQIRQKDGEYWVGNAAPHPVVMVTWNGADAYCQWAGGRLPTEAEWEYAARGPEGSIYPWGNDEPSCELARYGDCPRSPTSVGSFPEGASWCGALDMAGNVWEWVADWFGRYPARHQGNPTGPSSGSYRVLRGGGWHSPQWEIRTTFRLHDTAPSSYNG